VVLRLLVRVAEARPALSRIDLPQQLLALKPVPSLPWFKRFNDHREEDAALYLLTFTGQGLQMVPPSASSEPAQ